MVFAFTWSKHSKGKCGYIRHMVHVIKIVSENPYTLAKDISGICFLRADKLIRKVGVTGALNNKS